MSSYYDMDGKPIERMDWIKRFVDDDARRIGSEDRDGVHVSTVYLGLNHAWDDGPPLIFETMIFGGDHDEYQERYSTKAQAEEGHKRAVELAFGNVVA